MSSLVAGIADAVVTELNGNSFSQEFTAIRRWFARWSLAELATLRLTVLPGPSQFSPLDRRRLDQRHDTDVAVQKKIDPSVNAEVDALVQLMEELADYLTFREATAAGRGIKCTMVQFVPGTQAAIAREQLEDWRTFTGVVRATWRVRQ